MKKLFLILAIIIIGVVGYLKYSKKEAKPEISNRKDIALFKKPDELFVRHIDEGPKEINTLQDKANQKSLHEGVAAWVGVYRLELVANPLPKNKKVLLGLYINNSIGQQLSPKATKIYLQPVLEDGKVEDLVRPLRPLGDGLFVTTEDYPALPKKYLVTGELAGKKFSLTFNIINFRLNKIQPNEN